MSRAAGASSVPVLISNSISGPLQTSNWYIIIPPVQLPIRAICGSTCDLFSRMCTYPEKSARGMCLLMLDRGCISIVANVREKKDIFEFGEKSEILCSDKCSNKAHMKSTPGLESA